MIQHQYGEELPQGFPGFIIAGTHPRCGKTVVTAGLYALFSQQRIQLHAYKPLEFLPPSAPSRGMDQQFFQQVARPLLQLETMSLPSAYEVTPMMWNRVKETYKQFPYPALLEMPGSVAAPLRFEGHYPYNPADLSRDLQMPVLLVLPKIPQLLAQTVPSFAYLQSRSVNVFGWIGVETVPSADTPFWEREALYLSQEFHVPCLGTIPYSPSISVESQRQGNLIRITETAVDMLPFLERFTGALV